MSKIRYGKAFHYPRQIVKRFFSFIYPLVIRIWPLPVVLSIEETINKIIDEKLSICRFGDGEFLFLIDKLNLPFQQYDQILADKFKEILVSDIPNILVGLPIGYHSLHNLNQASRLTWRSQIAWIYPRLYKYINHNKIYANASMTRLYIEYKDKLMSEYYFNLVKKIWNNRNVIVIEGEQSRLGVGNDLFENVESIRRILGPPQNAFFQFKNLLNEALKYKKDTLFLIAMGPTAKPLAFELAQRGYQAVDIGNVDIEYEWFKMNAQDKVKIDGKYTSEASGGRLVKSISNDIYNSQILNKYL